MIVNREDIKERENIFSSYNDSFAQDIVDKIISLTVCTSFATKIDNQIPDYCFQKLKQGLQAFTEIHFITHDRDDLIIDDNTDLIFSRTNQEVKQENLSGDIKEVSEEESKEE
ncbi:MAG: hypothetical protein MJ252_19605, partial [archaeon]|nr:hypothetical protein [archaeon]